MTLILLLLMGLSGLIAVYIQRAANCERKERIGNRKVLSYEEWFRIFYADENLHYDKVKYILKIIADGIEVAPTQLRLTDRCDKELGLYDAPFSDGWEFFDGFLETTIKKDVLQKYKQLGMFHQWQTLDDVIRGTILLLREGSKKRLFDL